jgi:hypothetical protein
MSVVSDVVDELGIKDLFGIYADIEKAKIDSSAARLQNQANELKSQVQLLSLQRDYLQTAYNNSAVPTSTSNNSLSNVFANPIVLIVLGLVGFMAFSK